MRISFCIYRPISCQNTGYNYPIRAIGARNCSLDVILPDGGFHASALFSLLMTAFRGRNQRFIMEWAILEPMLPGQRGQWGGIAEDNRRFINGMFWILRTGAPWRDLPPDYGKWGSVHQRFRRWRDKGIWEKILEALIDDPDYEWLMIDASHCKVHPHAAGAKGGNQDMSRTKGGSTPRFTLPWIRLVCRSELLSQKAPELIARRLYTLSRK